MIDHISASKLACLDYQVSIDTRPHSTYTQSRLKNAINISLPTTLLKRNKNLLSILSCLSPNTKNELQSKLQTDATIIVYDQCSVSAKPSSSLMQLCTKLDDLNKECEYKYHIIYIDGGFNALSSEQVDSEPVVSSPQNSSSLFIDTKLKPSLYNFKKPELPNSEVQNLPEWLKFIYQDSKNDNYIDKIRNKFTKIEALEKIRLSQINNSPNTNSGPEKQKLKIDSNLNQTFTTCPQKICSPSTTCPVCDEITYSLPLTNASTKTPQQQLSATPSISSEEEAQLKNRYKNIWPYEHSRVHVFMSPVSRNSSLSGSPYSQFSATSPGLISPGDFNFYNNTTPSVLNGGSATLVRKGSLSSGDNNTGGLCESCGNNGSSGATSIFGGILGRSRSVSVASIIAAAELDGQCKPTHNYRSNIQDGSKIDNVNDTYPENIADASSSMPSSASSPHTLKDEEEVTTTNIETDDSMRTLRNPSFSLNANKNLASTNNVSELNLTKGSNRFPPESSSEIDNNPQLKMEMKLDSNPPPPFLTRANSVKRSSLHNVTQLTNFSSQPLNSQSKKIRKSDYINANHITYPNLTHKKYIASQNPLPKTYEEFWKVIWYEHVSVIISLDNSNSQHNMLTNISANNATPNGVMSLKKYWDDFYYSSGIRVVNCAEDDSVELKNIYDQIPLPLDKTDSGASNLSAKELLKKNGIQINHIQLIKYGKKKNHHNRHRRRVSLDKSNGVIGSEKQNEGTEVRNVYQVQFSEWPDFGVPQNFYSVLLLASVKNYILSQDIVNGENDIESNNCLVHCSAGCGRTGSFISVDMIIDCFEKFKHEKERPLINPWDSTDLVYLTVQELRKQRILMVQNLDQFCFIYEVVLNFVVDYFNSNTQKLLIY